MNDFAFEPPLSEGVIVRRKSQFTMAVLFDGEEQAFHFPTTGRIGNLDVSGRPCLLSLARGVEIWQANFELTPERVRLDKYFRIEV